MTLFGNLVIDRQITWKLSYLFLVYLTTLSVNQTMDRWMVGWLMNRILEVIWYNLSCPNLRYYRGMYLVTLRKIGLWADIWIQDFPNMMQ